MSPKASSSGAYVRGVDASTGVLLQPKGSVPRASNLVLTKRGSLRSCDGTAILAEWNGTPTPGRGQSLCDFLYAPIGTSQSFLRVMELLDVHLGAPTHLAAADGGTGGSLSGPFFYKVAALDGAGGSTTPSNEATVTVAAGHKVNLSWNVVPNAFGYIVYRSTTTGAERNLVTTPFPIPQPAPGATSVTFVDTGFTTGSNTPPPQDTTSQTGLFVVPFGVAVSYSLANLRAVWPAAFNNVSGMTLNTTSPGNVSLIPQIVQFVNQAIIALGNAYPPQIYRDPSTPDDKAVTATISAMTVDAFGVVTVTTSAHGLTAANVGANVFISGVTPSQFNGTFPTLTIPDGTHVTLRNLAAIGHSYVSGGTMQVTTIPVASTFLPDFPAWAAKASYALNTIVEPVTSPTSYFQAISPAAGGLSAATEPSWPQSGGADGNGLGLTVQDGNITWQNAGLISSAAPPPPGAAHLTVYAGALWVWDTSPTNTSNGLDGPCCLRMSDVNEPNSWNPVNTAFLDKDDGTEGEGLLTFTITAQGIPPEGSLVACKLYATYQIIGVFGSANFAIQRVVTDMGCTAPRTLLFVPGYGIGRLTHLGIAVFDGVSDRLISPQVVPYLFPSTDPELADIVAADPQWTAVSQSALTANPTMYCVFIPISDIPGNSDGQLTRVLCFDLVLKAWCVIDLPFGVSTALQARGSNFNAITAFGSFSDGTLQRWQAGDVTWATGQSGSSTPALVAGSLRTPVSASKDPEERLYCRRAIVIGQVGQQPPATMSIQPRVNGVAQTAQSVLLPTTGRFAVQAGVALTSDMFDAIISFTGDVTIDAASFDLTPKPLGVLTGMIG